MGNDGWYFDYAIGMATPEIKSHSNNGRSYSSSLGIKLNLGYIINNWLVIESSVVDSGDITEGGRNK